MRARMYLTGIIGVILLTTVLLTTASGKDRVPAERDVRVGSTLENLQFACVSEVQAHAEYSGYAAKADDEGFHQVAAMFRAIARAEQVHSTLLAGLSGKACSVDISSADYAPATSTRENAEIALSDQLFEQSEMYPKFIERAEREKNTEAVRLFKRIRDSEASHRMWYEQVLQDLNNYTATGAEFYVCPDCGSVSRNAKAKCPCCNAPKTKLERIS